MAEQVIKVPDIGDYTDVPVIDVYISEGDEISKEDPLIALESAKAVMDVPSPYSGKILEVLIKEGDTVSKGDSIARMEIAQQKQPGEDEAEQQEEPAAEKAPEQQEEPGDAAEEDTQKQKPEPPKEEVPVNRQEPGGTYHAAPSVRQFARRVGIQLKDVKASGPKGRMLREDVESLIHEVVTSSASGPNSAFPSVPSEDFSVYGPVEEQELSRIQKIAGPHLHASWVNIPHVTHYDEADVTELEAFRRQLRDQGEKHSILSFVIPAVSAALKEFPQFNSSLLPAGDRIILKRYYHLGIAVDTPQGLVVPVIRDADKKTVRELTEELKAVSQRAREGKLKLDDIKGGSFSISSLGGIGGTGFTPIVNAPETAILGLSAMEQKPKWDEQKQAFVPRLILPFSVSYDHRVIDGAAGARFARYFASLMEDIRRVLL